MTPNLVPEVVTDLMLGLAVGWLLGIGTAVLLLQFAAAALADRGLDDLDAPELAEPDPTAPLPDR